MSLGLPRPPLADSMMLTLTSHYTATNAKHHRYAATNPPDRPRATTHTAGRSDPGAGRQRGRQSCWAPGVPSEPGAECAGGAGACRLDSVPGAGAHARAGCRSVPTGVEVGRWGRREPGYLVADTTQAIRGTGGTTGRTALRVSRQTACDLGIVTDSRGWASRADPGLAGHVRLASNLEHKNPSASDIHPRNRTPMGNVSLGTDDAIQGHRTGPDAIPRNKEGKDGC